MLGEPAPTPADVHFNVAGFPVRIHPLFWVISLVIGLNAFDGEPAASLLAIGVVLVSILVHELGHAFLQRKYGGNPRIVLHGFGGLAIASGCDRSPRSQILISLAGPVAGFLLAAVVVLLIFIATGFVEFVPFWGKWSASAGELYELGKLTGSNLLFGDLLFARFESPLVNSMMRMLLWVNIFWGLMNLLPVYPLDGGQIAREVLTMGPVNPQQGVVRSLKLSIGVAVVAGVLGIIALRSPYTGILFGFLAYNNWRTLQAYTGNNPGYGW